MVFWHEPRALAAARACLGRPRPVPV